MSAEDKAQDLRDQAQKRLREMRLETWMMRGMTLASEKRECATQ